MKENSTSEQDRAAAVALAAADDVRIRRRRLAIGTLVLGILLGGGSLLLWPQGLFAIASRGTAESLPLVVLGAAFTLGGAALIAVAIRRLSRLRNQLTSVGKAHGAFVNEPDFQLPSIGLGHGGALDASAAKFANPSKLLPGRDR